MHTDISSVFQSLQGAGAHAPRSVCERMSMFVSEYVVSLCLCGCMRVGGHGSVHERTCPVCVCLFCRFVGCGRVWRKREGGGTLDDAFAFLLTNFTESARLWVRLQHQGSSRERQKREKERHDLRVLVGSTLVRMAQLDGMSVEFYKEEALPRLLEQVIGCRDGMAQQYLLDCIIQVFSDECHLQTLDIFLQACLSVQPSGIELPSIFAHALSSISSSYLSICLPT